MTATPLFWRRLRPVLCLDAPMLAIVTLLMAACATTRFSRLLGGAVTMILFTYAFINIGMVCGVVPVVGVPLPFFSYGGTALGTLGVACGILMAIRRQSIAGPGYNCLI